MSRDKRFESARRLSLFGLDKPNSLRKVVLFSITPWDAEGWFAHCGYGSKDQCS